MLLANNEKINSLKNSNIIYYLKWIFLLLVCLLGFLYSLYYAENWDKLSELYTPDEGNYIAMAKRLLGTGVYGYWGDTPDAYVTPGYPLFLAACMSVFGTSLQALHCIKIVQCVMTGLSVFLVFLVGYLSTKRYAVGIIAAVLMALNGLYPYFSRYLLTETLSVFTSLLFFAVILCATQKNKWWLYLLSGITLCVATMVRPLIVIVFPCIVVAEIIIKWKNHKVWLRNIGFFILGFIIVAMPWWIRNAVTLNQFIPLATQTNPMYAGLAPDVEALGLQDPGTLFGNVILLIKLLFTKPLSTVYWMTFGKFSKIFFDTNSLPYLFELYNIVKNTTVVLGIFGFLRALFSKKHRCTAIIFFIYLLSILLFIPVSRYAVGYLPLLAVAAGYLLDTSFQTLKE